MTNDFFTWIYHWNIEYKEIYMNIIYYVYKWCLEWIQLDLLSFKFFLLLGSIIFWGLVHQKSQISLDSPEK